MRRSIDRPRDGEITRSGHARRQPHSSDTSCCSTRTLQGAQLRPRIEAQLFGQRAACPASYARQRFRLSPRAVQRQDELLVEPLVKRHPLHELAQVADRLPYGGRAAAGGRCAAPRQPNAARRAGLLSPRAKSIPAMSSRSSPRHKRNRLVDLAPPRRSALPWTATCREAPTALHPSHSKRWASICVQVHRERVATRARSRAGPAPPGSAPRQAPCAGRRPAPAVRSPGCGAAHRPTRGIHQEVRGDGLPRAAGAEQGPACAANRCEPGTTPVSSLDLERPEDAELHRHQATRPKSGDRRLVQGA